MSLSTYTKLKDIGSGAFGEASLVERKSDYVKFVLKRIKFSDEKELEDCKKEVSFLAQLSHPNIVAYQEHFQEPNVMYLVMEYCSGGDLLQCINEQKDKKQHLSEKRIITWTLQILDALKFLHVREKPILHRDLKPANIFLTDNGRIKIGDFGISRSLANAIDLASTMAGTPIYMCPEIRNGEKYDYKCDIWSLGCIIYEMIALNYAVDAKELWLHQKVMINPIPSNNYSKELIEIVMEMLSIDCKMRPSTEQAISRLSPLQVPTLQSTAEEDVRKLGYMFNSEGQLKDISTGGPFKYTVSQKSEDNERRYQEVAKAVTTYIWERLEKDHDMEVIFLPVDLKANEPSTFIFATPDIYTNDKLLILVTGPHPIRAGVWSRMAVVNDSIDAGSQIPWIRQAKKDGFAVLLLNHNQVYSVENGQKVPIRDNSNSVEHAVYVWDKIITQKTKATKIAFIAHRTGGYVTAELAMKRSESFTKLVFAVGLCESTRHTSVLQTASKPVTDLFLKHSKHWVANSKPAGTALKKNGLAAFLSRDKNNISQISSGDERTEWAISASMNLVFEFLRIKYLDRLEFLCQIKECES